MKRFRPSLRRVISVAIAGLAGAAATLFIATPAFAHHVNTSGTAVCDPAGGWNVTWTVASGGNWKPFYKILTANSTPVGGPIEGALGSLPTAYKPIAQTFTGTQHFDASVASATLTATAMFSTSADADTQTESGGTQIQTQVGRPNCNADAESDVQGQLRRHGDRDTGQPAGQRARAPSPSTAPTRPCKGGQKLEVTVPGNERSGR